MAVGYAGDGVIDQPKKVRQQEALVTRRVDGGTAFGKVGQEKRNAAGLCSPRRFERDVFDL